MNGLSGLNVELTSRCNKNCFMCGRRKLEKDHPDLCAWGDMPVAMVEDIAREIPPGVFVQFHNNGEPLLYEKLDYAVSCFKNSGCYTGLDTNGKLLLERADEIIGRNLDTITISVIPDDPEGQEQLDIAINFLDEAQGKKPLVVFRLLGEIDSSRRHDIAYMMMSCNAVACTRVLHAPEGSRAYEKPVTIPEIGVCLEMLHKLSIDRYGDVFPCVRFDPKALNLLGSLSDGSSLEERWYGDKRKEWLRAHIEGRRNDVPLCASCDYWGVPRGN